MINDINIDTLKDIHCAELSKMLKMNSKEYQQYFIPFSFEEKDINNLLLNVNRDKYWGIWINQELVSFFMLRGFDGGYEIPSFGVCVSESFQGKGILKLSLQFAITWCKINNIHKIMLKVHPENTIAKNTYEKIGFVMNSIDPKNHNLIYYYTL